MALRQKEILLALGELLKAAATEDKQMVRKVISTYRHTVKYPTNLKAVNNTSFSHSHLEECLKFLKLQTRDATTNEEIYETKATKADRIVIMIETYFPQTCQECQEKYRNKRDDKDPYSFTCFLCLQGSHNCEQIRERKRKCDDSNITNQVWLCEGCYSKNNLSTPNNPKRTRHPSQVVSFQGDIPQDIKATELAVAAATAAQEAAEAKKASDEAAEKAETEKQAEAAAEEDDETDTAAAKETAEKAAEAATAAKKKAEEAEKKAQDAEIAAQLAVDAEDAAELDKEIKEAMEKSEDRQRTTEGEDKDTREICDKYRRSVCPHGLRGTILVGGRPCKFAHPSTCYKFCKNGPGTDVFSCNKGNSCEKFHPTLCKYSVKDRVCTDRSCTYIHLRGTRRGMYNPSDRPRGNPPSSSHHPQSVRTSSKPRDTRQKYPPIRRQEESRGGTPSYNRRHRTHSTSSNTYPKLQNRFGLLETPKTEEDSPEQNKETASFLMKFMEEMKIGLQKSQDEMRADLRRELNDLRMTSMTMPLPQLQPQPLPWMQIQQQDHLVNPSMPQKVPFHSHPQMVTQMMPHHLNLNPLSGC